MTLGKIAVLPGSCLKTARTCEQQRQLRSAPQTRRQERGSGSLPRGLPRASLPRPKASARPTQPCAGVYLGQALPQPGAWRPPRGPASSRRPSRRGTPGPARTPRPLHPPPAQLRARPAPRRSPREIRLGSCACAIPLPGERGGDSAPPPHGSAAILFLGRRALVLALAAPLPLLPASRRSGRRQRGCRAEEAEVATPAAPVSTPGAGGRAAGGVSGP